MGSCLCLCLLWLHVLTHIHQGYFTALIHSKEVKNKYKFGVSKVKLRYSVNILWRHNHEQALTVSVLFNIGVIWVNAHQFICRLYTSFLVASAWWRHQMETFSALLVLCVGNSLVTGEFPAQRLVTRSFDVFFDLSRNKRLSKQSWG